MAAHDDGLGESGSMDISQHKKDWAAFTKFVRYSLGFILLIMVFLAIFRTHH